MQGGTSVNGLEEKRNSSAPLLADERERQQREEPRRANAAAETILANTVLASEIMHDREQTHDGGNVGGGGGLCARLPPTSELYVYALALFCGVSIMLPTNAVFSAPSYVMNYYKYATHNASAVPRHPHFWNNSLTYYSALNMVVSLVMEPLTLTPRFREVAIQPRLLVGVLILMAEVILLMAVPARGTSEGGAIATLCIAGLMSGLGKSLFESTAYGMFGAFPAGFISTLMGGVGMSGVLTSLIQITVKGTLGDGYENVITQSRVYYGLDIGLQCCTFSLVLLLPYSSFAQRCLAGLGGTRGGNTDDGHTANHGSSGGVVHPAAAGREAHGEAAGGAPTDSDGGVTPSDANVKSGGAGEGLPPMPAERRATQIILADASSPSRTSGGEAAAEDPTAFLPSEGRMELLMATGIVDTFKKIYWMCIACGFNFLVTLMLFPTVTVSADGQDYWYGTIAVFLFNVFDVLGRFTPSLKCTWPRSYEQRYLIVAGSFARVVFAPLLILYSFHVITGHAFGYVMMVCFGATNGYISSMALILSLMSRGINSDGQRFVSGTMMSTSILIGGTLGMVLSICMQAARGN